MLARCHSVAFAQPPLVIRKCPPSVHIMTDCCEMATARERDYGLGQQRTNAPKTRGRPSGSRKPEKWPIRFAKAHCFGASDINLIVYGWLLFDDARSTPLGVIGVQYPDISTPPSIQFCVIRSDPRYNLIEIFQTIKT